MGRYQGGEGVVREYEFLSAATATINSERRLNAPYGLAGGGEGGRGRNRVIQAGEEFEVGGKYTTRLEAGDRVIIETPGGGGWGELVD